MAHLNSFYRQPIIGVLVRFTSFRRRLTIALAHYPPFFLSVNHQLHNFADHTSKHDKLEGLSNVELPNGIQDDAISQEW